MDLARNAEAATVEVLAETASENDTVPRATKLGSLGYVVT